MNADLSAPSDSSDLSDPSDASDVTLFLDLTREGLSWQNKSKGLIGAVQDGEDNS